jgi:hypothetical protein
MMDEMKLCVLLWVAAAAWAGDLGQIKTVYLLPMTGSLDMHLANRLTDGHVLLVVTDPKKADAIFTDRLGPAFEDRMADLYPPPEPPAPPKEKSKELAGDPGGIAAGLGGDTVNKVQKVKSTFGGGKGTVFLVDVKSRNVLWSVYAKPKYNRSDTLEKTALKITQDLKKSFAAK